LHLLDINEDNTPSPGRWYNAGKTRVVNMLKNVGYEVINEDIGVDYRSPIIHFKKP